MHNNGNCHNTGAGEMNILERRHTEETAAAPALKTSFFRAVALNLASHKLGELFLLGGMLNRTQLETALFEQDKTGEKIGKILVRQGAVSAVHLYRKLAEQWCLRASAAGITLILQGAMPSVAQADSTTSLTPQFQMAAATLPSSVYKTPGLFGTHEVKSNDISAFKKWTDVMYRFEEQTKATRIQSPRLMLWKAEIQRLKGKSQRDQVEGVNAFLNQVPYIEDNINYGKTDYWATPIEFLTRGGDCEDFAIAKYASLRALGFSVQQLRIAIVQDEIKNIPHAILIVYSDSDTFVLDNQDKKVEQAAMVSRYKPIFSINSSSWWLHRA